MFTRQGRYKVTITDAYCAERSKFDGVPEDAFNVAIEVQEIDGDGEGAWTGEVSNRYGIGNAAGKTQTQMTAEALLSTGWDPGLNAAALAETLEDIQSEQRYEDCEALLQSIIGQETTVKVEETKKGDLVVKYLGGGTWRPKRLGSKPIADPFA